MFFRNILSALLILTFFPAAFGQTAEKEKPKTVTDELRKEAVAFLRETNAEVGTLRSLENRISFASEMAGLMWFYDEKEAAAMYQTVITDFKQLLADYDTQMNTLGIKSGDWEYGGGLWSGREQEAKPTFIRKFQKAMSVRQQIAMSLAEHDAVLAYNFYYDTLGLITNAEFRKQIEQRDTNFETQLIKQIALKDAAKALEMARRSLAKGVNWTQVELLQKIYEKDDAKGAEFAAEVVKKFKEDKVSASNTYHVASFLSAGADNFEKIKKEGGKKPMFTEQNLRELAELLAQNILDKKEAGEFSASNVELVEKYAPARAIQIRAKFPALNKPKAAVTKVSGTTDGTLVAKTMTRAEVEAQTETQTKAQKEKEETMKNVMKLNSRELPKEERDKIVAQARKIIGGMGNKMEKIMALSTLASQVTAAGDKELAAEILKDAQPLVNPEPKNYRDFTEVWFLVSAYAANDAEKAFPLLDDAIERLNGTLSAFIKVGEFIDVSGEIVDDGEVQVGSFGGSMMSGITRELGIANITIRNLAIADFGKTKNLTNKFDRTEVRILAKMLVLRAVLGDETKSLKPEMMTEDVEGY